MHRQGEFAKYSRSRSSHSAKEEIEHRGGKHLENFVRLFDMNVHTMPTSLVSFAKTAGIASISSVS